MDYSEHVLNTVRQRLLWYKSALEIVKGIVPKPNDFDYPTSTNDPFSPEAMWEWRGAIRELQNTIHMLQHK